MSAQPPWIISASLTVGSFVPAVLWRHNKHRQWTNTRLAVWLFVDLCSKNLNDKGHVIDLRSCIVCVRCSSLFHDLRNETQVWSAGLLITQHGIRLAQSSMTLMLESVAAEYSCAAVAETTLNLFHHLETLFQQGCLVKHCQNKCSGLFFLKYYVEPKSDRLCCFWKVKFYI